MNQNSSDKNQKKKKALLALIILPCLILFFVGIVSAFFSDMISETGNMTTGTLKLNCSYTFYLNGQKTDSDKLGNLNPGDVVVIKGTISNTGNQSAWIRDEITLIAPALLPYIEVYSQEYTQSELMSGADLSEYLIAVNENGKAYSETRVIKGNGSDDQGEINDDYVYLDSSEYNVTFTVYFAHSAGNDAQDKTLTLTVGAKAIQFANNNASMPDEAAWASVKAVSR